MDVHSKRFYHYHSWNDFVLLFYLSDMILSLDVNPCEIDTFLSFPFGNKDKVFDPGILIIDGIFSFTRKAPLLLIDNFMIDKCHILSEISLMIESSVVCKIPDKYFGALPRSRVERCSEVVYLASVGFTDLRLDSLFRGLCTENPIHHIKHFLSIVDHIQANGATRDASRLRFFHFTLKGKAKEWLDKIPPGTITSWEQIVSKFLDKLFPPKRIARIRDKILWFCQSDNESIKDAWKRFQDMLHQAFHHGIKKWLLVQLFYDNIIPKDKEKLNQFTQFRFSSLNEDEGWDRIEELIQYQDDI
ncbi:zinc finger, CCHC-type containing protein [Tanacetum coccineum]